MRLRSTVSASAPPMNVVASNECDNWYLWYGRATW
jgi:hypothetical protein